MKTVVVDFNKIFSALLKPSRIRETLLSDGSNRFAAPNFVFIELFKHFLRVQRFSIHTPEELIELIEQMVNVLELYPDSHISPNNRQLAYDLCKDIDPDDTPYVALTLELEGQLWTGDTKLKNGLIAKGFDRFFEP